MRALARTVGGGVDGAPAVQPRLSPEITSPPRSRSRPWLVNFNQIYKLSPTAAHLWCGALRRAPAAALWLLLQPLDGAPFVRAELQACGLATARRLAFGEVVGEIGAHLVRTARAELLVDTPEYNCHTTGSDALWAGVPMITLAGEQMAARVGASLVRASGAAAGQVHSLRQYEDAAVRLISRDRHDGDRGYQIAWS